MSYVDGFVIPLPKNKVAEYRKMARVGRRVWMDHGALKYVEAIGEDLAVPFGLPFPKGIRLKKNETVVFAFIVYRSRAHRDRVNAKVMKDPRIGKTMTQTMPFDPKRMMYGGFKAIVEA